MQSQLSVRSAKARELAHRLARTEGRTVADVVERALEAYAQRHEETAEAVFQRLAEVDADQSQQDLGDLIEKNRKPLS